MKKFLFFIVVVSFLFGDEFLDLNQTPKEILSFMEKNYPNLKITHVLKDVDEYEVLTNENTKIEFYTNLSLKSVKSYHEIPSSIVPKKILSYVKQNYPNNYIIEYERDNDVEIELNNNLSLEFDLNGNFLKID